MPIKAALGQSWRGWHLSRKLDGVFRWQGDVCGELLPDGSFWPFDVRCPGQWADRLPVLKRQILANAWQSIPCGHGVEFIEAMIALARRDNTPDVCVAKPLDAPFGVGLVKIKLVDTYDVIVTDASGAQLSVAIAYQGQPAGRVMVRGPARDCLQMGDIIEIGGTLLPSGKFREARFVRVRADKAPL